MTNTSERFRAVLDGSGLFAPAVCREYAWTAAYTTQDYLTLLGTHSDHRMLEPDVRRRLLDSIAQAIEAHGGTFQVPNVAVLSYARAT
jgi:hypothetical protein